MSRHVTVIIRHLVALLAPILLSLPAARAQTTATAENRAGARQPGRAEQIRRLMEEQEQEREQAVLRRSMSVQGAGTLFPGQTVQFRGVTLSWNVDGGPATTGTLLLRSDRNQIRVPTPRLTQPDGDEGGSSRGVRDFSTTAYLGDARFSLDLSRRDNFIIYRAEVSPSHRTVPGSEDKASIYCSHAEPAFLNDWQLTVSDTARAYPDGRAYFELVVKSADGRGDRMPLVSGTSQTFGRYRIVVDRFYSDTLTAELVVEAAVDRSIRGRDAYIGSYELTNGLTLGKWLEQLSDQYGFDVEWVPMPAAAQESIDYAKGLSFGARRQFNAGILDDLLKTVVPDSAAAFEWTDATHLRVWPTQYESYLAEQEQDRRREDAVKSFQSQKPITRVYKISHLSPKTAFALIEQNLRKVGLYEIVDDFKVMSEDDAPTFGRGRSKPLAAFEDQALLDEQAGAVIVTAMPETHERIREVLDKTGLMLSQSKSQAPLQQYQIELTLLRGVARQNGSTADIGMRRELKVFSREAGVVLENKVVPGRKVKVGDVLMRLDPDDLQRELEHQGGEMRRVEQNLALTMQQVEMNRKKIESGALAQSEAIRQEAAANDLKVALEQLKSRMQAIESRIDNLTVRAPVDGVIASPGINPGVNERIDQNRLVATLGWVEDDPMRQASDPDTLKALGISPEDLKSLGLASCEPLGRTVVSLNNLPGEEGAALVSLGDDYRCRLTYVDRRDPLLIVRAALLPADENARPLIENTLFLETNKPSILGLTNMRDALVLIARRK